VRPHEKVVRCLIEHAASNGVNHYLEEGSRGVQVNVDRDGAQNTVEGVARFSVPEDLG
jgi:hypothetical protein